MSLYSTLSAYKICYHYTLYPSGFPYFVTDLLPCSVTVIWLPIKHKCPANRHARQSVGPSCYHPRVRPYVSLSFRATVLVSLSSIPSYISDPLPSLHKRYLRLYVLEFSGINSVASKNFTSKQFLPMIWPSHPTSITGNTPDADGCCSQWFFQTCQFCLFPQNLCLTYFFFPLRFHYSIVLSTFGEMHNEQCITSASKIQGMW